MQIENLFTNSYKWLQYNKPPFLIFSPYNQLVRSTRSSAVVTLQRPSNPSYKLKISDRSSYFQAPALWNALPHHLRSHSHASQSHSLLSLYLLLNSTSSWKLTFFFIPFLLNLASLYWTSWPLGTLIWPVCHSLFIPYPSSSIRSSAKLVLILFVI